MTEIYDWVTVQISTKTCCVCVKRITLCNCPCSSCDSVSLIWNIGNSEQKTVLQTIEQLMQYTVLEIQFRSLRHTAVMRIRKNLSNFPFLFKRYKEITVCRCKKPTSSSFETLQTVYTFSNCTINQLLYCWEMF